MKHRLNGKERLGILTKMLALNGIKLDHSHTEKAINLLFFNTITNTYFAIIRGEL